MQKLLLLLILILLAPQLSRAQDPVRDIDPTMPGRRDNVERQALPRDEIPGTIRDTQRDQERFPDENSSDTETESSGIGISDTTSIQFVDENGKVIRNPNDYTRKKNVYAPERRKAADTIEYFPGRDQQKLRIDTTSSKP
jgi:hypothetical protein